MLIVEPADSLVSPKTFDGRGRDVEVMDGQKAHPVDEDVDLLFSDLLDGHLLRLLINKVNIKISYKYLNKKFRFLDWVHLYIQKKKKQNLRIFN